ncbi:MAG: sugar ABC transporter permease [Ruminococcaceae bacterium]|nr:sugar ABC transporter permease [Oscillospiraceae bacterium]HHV31634.1 sugar ABC transporter permease [Clostridiales bacterium]
MEKSLKKYFPVFVLPTLIAFVIAFVIPFIMGIYLSFTKFTTVTDSKWVGIKNYVTAFSNKDFLHALIFTTYFAVISVVSINILAFLVAYFLTRGIKGSYFFRTLFFMPNLIGGIVLGYIWQVIFNGVLYRFDMTLTSNAQNGFWGLVILMNWQMIGYMMVIYIAGFQNIPRDLIDAAKVDGVTPLTAMRHVTLPLMMPSITINLFLTLTNSFKLFDQNLALTAGAPAKQTQMLALDIYNTFYSRMGWEGVGQAKAVIFFIIVAAISLTQLYLTRRKEVDA